MMAVALAGRGFRVNLCEHLLFEERFRKITPSEKKEVITKGWKDGWV